MKRGDISNATPEVPATQRATRLIAGGGEHAIWFRFLVDTSVNDLYSGLVALLADAPFPASEVRSYAAHMASEISAERELGILTTDQERIDERGDTWAQ